MEEKEGNEKNEIDKMKEMEMKEKEMKEKEMKEKEEMEENEKDDYAYLICPCPLCKSGRTIKKHGPSCCFAPGKLLSTQKEKFQCKETYCSFHCDVEAYELFQLEPSLLSLMKRCEFKSNILIPILQRNNMKIIIIKNLEETANTNKKFYVDDMLLPNFIVNKIESPLQLFKKAMELGFDYDINDNAFVTYLIENVSVSTYWHQQNFKNGWLQSIIDKDEQLADKLSSKIMFKVTGLKFNSRDNNNKKQKLQDQ